MSEQKSPTGPEAPPLTPQGATGRSQGGERSGGDQVARDILTTQQSGEAAAAAVAATEEAGHPFGTSGCRNLRPPQEP